MVLGSPKMAEGDPEKATPLGIIGLELGHFQLCYRGDKLGNPLKVNIS